MALVQFPAALLLFLHLRKQERRKGEEEEKDQVNWTPTSRWETQLKLLALAWPSPVAAIWGVIQWVEGWMISHSLSNK